MTGMSLQKAISRHESANTSLVRDCSIRQLRSITVLTIRTPDAIHRDMFDAVQAEHFLADSKTFVNSIPKSDPDAI